MRTDTTLDLSQKAEKVCLHQLTEGLCNFWTTLSAPDTAHAGLPGQFCGVRHTSPDATTWPPDTTGFGILALGNYSELMISYEKPEEIAS